MGVLEIEEVVSCMIVRHFGPETGNVNVLRQFQVNYLLLQIQTLKLQK